MSAKRAQQSQTPRGELRRGWSTTSALTKRKLLAGEACQNCEGVPEKARGPHRPLHQLLKGLRPRMGQRASSKPLALGPLLGFLGGTRRALRPGPFEGVGPLAVRIVAGRAVHARQLPGEELGGPVETG